VNLNEAPDGFKLPEGMISLQEIMNASEDNITIELSLKDMALLTYTGGTTGLPKAVTYWQGKLVGGNSLYAMTGGFKVLFLLGNDIIFTSNPLFHANALFLNGFTAFLNERPFILAKRFSARRHWDMCRKYKVTQFNTLGAMIPILMKQPIRPNDKEHDVAVVHSAACPKEVWEAFENRFNVKIREYYAATDGGGFMLTSLGAEDRPVGSMGKPLQGTIASILDDDGTHLGPEEICELVFEWKKKTLPSIYYKNEEASKSLIRQDKDGKNWFCTGDLAYIDEDGWYFYVDRKKDVIRRRGENIAAYSVERIVNQNEKVLESAAYGIKTELGEDDVMVAIVLQQGSSMIPEELLDYCRGKMADFMIPRYIEFVDELPKNMVHRILKRELKIRGITQNTYDREK